MKVTTDGVLLGAWTNSVNASSILDIGTGTGLVAIMLAQKSDAYIHAIEIEPHACRQAAENVKKSPWRERISIIHSSFQDYSRYSDNRYDLIVSNPPFFTNSLKTQHEGRNLARHNETLPPDELLRGVDRLLSPSGSFCVILPYIDSSLFLVDAAMHNLYCVRRTNVKANAGKKVTRVLMELCRERRKILENNLLIHESDGDYSEDFKMLAENYYLFL